jgi:iron complex transport system permease protein
VKILIDVDALHASGILDAALADKLRASATRDTGSGAINILLALGAVAVAAGLGALAFSAWLVAALGVAFIAAGGAVRRFAAGQWALLAKIWIVIGALVLTGGQAALLDRPMAASLIGALILGGIGVYVRSHLLVALSPFALEAALGGSTGYWSACYEICVREPTLTIALFTALGAGAWLVARRLADPLQGLALTFARVCVILVNFGFWIGSLWGDRPGHSWTATGQDWPDKQTIPELAFVVAWFVALALAGFWGARNGRRFLVNVCATFAAIHFYTQWFERFGPDPIAVIAAGVATIAIGLGFWRYNHVATA